MISHVKYYPLIAVERRFRFSCRLLTSQVRRRNLTSIKLLFEPPTDSTNYRKCVSNFLSSWLANQQWDFWQANHEAYSNPGTQVEAQEGFRRAFADGLNQSLVPSVTQASRFRFCLMSAPHLSHRVKNASSSIKQHRKLITRDDVVSQRHKFGSAFLSYFSWVSKNCLLFF